MSNHKDNSPELDYFELRRRHEQYKSRERMERSAEPAPAGKRPRADAPVEAEEDTRPVQPEIQKPADAFEEAIEEGYEDFEDEDFEAEDAAEPASADDVNPFGSFIHFFHGVKDNISARRAGKLEEDETADSIEDLPDDPSDAEGIETGFEDEDDAFIDDIDDDEYEDLEDLPEKQSGFKKFVGLFVQRVEDDEDASDADEDEDFEGEDFDFEDDEAFEDAEVDQSEKKSRFSLFGKKRAHDEEEDFEADEGEAPVELAAADLPAAPKAAEAAPQPKAEENAQPAAGMTRRERRELAMRLAAEEAARKAAEENKADLPAAEEKEAPVDMAAFENAPASDILVETTAEDSSDEAVVDEPTREFKPVSARDLQEAAEKNLFDLDADDEDEDEDEDFEEKKPRFSLFGKKRARVEEDDEDEDYDDEDDEDDEDFNDEDEDDEDFEEKKPRFSLFGKKRARVEEEDEDDEDEDDEDEDEFEEDEIADEYDDDEDDEYDEYDDEDEDYDDEYDEDEDEYDEDDEDDESRRSFGHHLLGVIKVILGIAAVLLVLMIAMNFHYYATGNNVVISFTHDVLGDSAAFELLCPSYSMRQNLVIPEPTVEAQDIAIVESTPAPTALPEPEATAVVPNLDTNSLEAALPTAEAVIEAAPAVEASAVTEGAVG